MPDVEGGAPAQAEVQKVENPTAVKTDGFLAKYPQLATVTERARANILKLATAAFVKSDIKTGDFEGAVEETTSIEDLRRQIAELAAVEEREGDAFSPMDRVAVRRGLSEVSSSVQDNVVEGAIIPTGEVSLLRGRLHMDIHRQVRDLAVAECDRIKSAYEGVLSQMLQEGDVVREVGEGYVNRFIKPEVDSLVEGGKMKPARRDELYQAINRIYDEKIGSAPQRHEILSPFLENHVGLGFEVRSHLEDLIKGIEIKGVNEIVSAKYIHEVESIASELDRIQFGERSMGGQWSYTLLKLDDLSKVSASRYFRGPSLLEQYSKLYKPEFGTSDRKDFSIVQFRPWVVLRSTPSIKALFPEEINRLDDRSFSTLLDLSVSDENGHFIPSLEHYPRPEAIRNLLLMIAADSKKYGSRQAEKVLGKFAKRSDWATLLDQAQAKYPELVQVRPLLERWSDLKEGELNYQIADASASLILSVMEAEKAKGREGSKKLIDLSFEALPNKALIELLVKDGIFSENEVSTIAKAEQIIEEEERKSDNGPGIAFGEHLKKNLRRLMQNQSTEPSDARDNVRNALTKAIKRFEVCAKKIVENREDPRALEYLGSSGLVEKVESTRFSEDDLYIFLDAYKSCPALTDNQELRNEFCRYFRGYETVEAYRDISKAYEGFSKQVLIKMINWVNLGFLTKDRVVELAQKATVIFNSDLYNHAGNFSELFLQTDEGVEFLSQVITGGVYSVGKELDKKMGAKTLKMDLESAVGFMKMADPLFSDEIERLNTDLLDGDLEINENNWHIYLMGYLAQNDDEGWLPEVNPVVGEKLNALFADTNTRDFCMRMFRESWGDYLNGESFEDMPFSLAFISSYIGEVGAGPLSQMESFSDFICSYREAFAKLETSEIAKSEIFQGVSSIEVRFTKERWSNDERRDFYNTSRDILNADPTLYADFLGLFKEMKPAELRRFAKELLPLYRAKLAMLAKSEAEMVVLPSDRFEEIALYNTDDLAAIKRDLESFRENLRTESTPFEMQQNTLIVNLKDLFAKKFGIIGIPEEFGDEQIRSLTNVSIYLANLEEKTPDKEVILGFYLALMLDNKWDDFRSGVEIDPKKYLVAEKAEAIVELLDERERLDPLTAEALGIRPEALPEFRKILGQESQNMQVGDVVTIDVKLNNVILNLKGLADMDLFPAPLDRARMQFLKDHGDKPIGAAVGKMMQQLANPAREIHLSDEEQEVQAAIEEILVANEIDLTPDTIKTHFQDGLKPFATVANILKVVEKSNAEKEIESLREMLKPSGEVVDIFTRLGEEFTTTSGALALSQDLSYLDNLVVKREKDLTDQERELIAEYTGRIREKVVQLQGIYEQIRNKYTGMTREDGDIENVLLETKLKEIDRIINSKATQQTITSIATSNMNDLIENMRECLSCTVQGANNDTNLTFGDSNKFYLYSQSGEKARGSVADQIVFLEPVRTREGQQDLAFVFDRLYGMSTPSVLESQIMTVIKKYRSLKESFPEAKLSLFITQAAIATGGISAEALAFWLMDNLPDTKDRIIDITELEVDVAESAAGEHYIEFGGEDREAGPRTVSGIRIKI